MALSSNDLSKVKYRIYVSASCSSSGQFAGTGGSPGLRPAPFPGSITCGIVVLSISNESYQDLLRAGYSEEEINEYDGITYMKLLSANLSNDSGELVWDTPNWGIKLWGSPDSYLQAKCDAGHNRNDAYPVPSDAVLFAYDPTGVIITGSSGKASGSWSYSNADGSMPTENYSAENIPSDEEITYGEIPQKIGIKYNLIKVERISNWERSEEERNLFFYVVGYVNTNSNRIIETEQTQSSAILIVSGASFDKLFDYYPWSMYSGGWNSLDRGGPATDLTGLHRYDCQLWIRETNKHGSDSSDDHAHRYNGASWVKSPKDQ